MDGGSTAIWGFWRTKKPIHTFFFFFWNTDKTYKFVERFSSCLFVCLLVWGIIDFLSLGFHRDSDEDDGLVA